MHGRLGRFGWSGLVLLALLAGAVSLSAQTISGVIAGQVRDVQGKGIGAVSINVRNPATGRSYVTSTDSEGYYRIPEIPPGEYEVLAENAGYQSVKHTPVLVSVNRVTVEDFQLKLAAEAVTIEVKASTSPMTDTTGPTIASSFPERQVRELPILTRDVNNLGLIAPGVLSVRTFSFGSTLVPFSSNGSRGRDNNFIIDSVDNNEPLFGGAATQFTNTDIFVEYTILTNQLKAEFGRNSGATVNVITRSGSNRMGGTLFWYGQYDRFNALSKVEDVALLKKPARYYENQIGATLGGPIVKEKTFYFISYQWDRARNNLTNVFPVIGTYPTAAGLTTLRGLPQTNALLALLAVPSVTAVPGQAAPCFAQLPPAPATGFNLLNPCRNPTNALVGATNVAFAPFLVRDGNTFDVRDHQWSARLDHRLSNSSDLYGRYLFDEIRAPRFPLAPAGDSAISDLGLFPDYRLVTRQRSQSLLVNHRYYWQRALNEFRFSFSRISTGTGMFQMPARTIRTQAAATVTDNFGGFGVFQPLFSSAGTRFTLGRDTGPSQFDTNIFQLQENYSYHRGNHSLKFGVNFVRIFSDIDSVPSNLGHYFFGRGGSPGLNAFATEPTAGATRALFVFQRLPNLISDPNTGLITGQGSATLKLREFDQFYFFQDDWRVSKNFTLSLGIRYENFGQPINRVSKLNHRAPFVRRDNNNFAPRLGFAWSPWSHTVFRGGYALMYNPMVLNIPLLIWQSGPVSPFFVASTVGGLTQLSPSGTFPNQPFVPANLNVNVTGCSTTLQQAFAGTVPLINCAAQDTVDTRLVNPYVHNFSFGLQQELSSNMLFEIGYVGSKGSKLFQRTDENPYNGWNTACTAIIGPSSLCINNRVLPGNSRGAITKVGNGGRSIYHSLQTNLTRRMAPMKNLGDVGFTIAYTWGHNIDNTSEIFGPGVRNLRTDIVSTFLASPTGLEPAEAISPFAQNPGNLLGDRASSSFDRRHRFVSSYLWSLGNSGHFLVGGWQLAGIITYQSGQPYTPLNGNFLANCADPGGFGRASTARPAIGNPRAPLDSVALLKDANCTSTALGYADRNGATIAPSAAHFVQVPLGFRPGQTFTVGASTFIAGSAGRNSLVGPKIINWDFSLLKNFHWGEGKTIQFRWEVYDLLNRRNPGNPIGNVFATDAQPSPAFAFSPRYTPAGVTGVIPENTIDARDPISGLGTFRSEKFMNASSRRMQFGLKFIF
ncbi:MAG: TonB-dependent receptor [Acidobacteria bacterium]|nr:TonB-dependent receptor [Acidobacteriota bacterium]